MIFPLLKFLFVFVAIFLWECGVSKQERVKYTDYAVYKFFPQTRKDVEIMTILHDKNPGVIFMKQPGGVNQSVDMLFPPHLQADLLQNMKTQMPSELITDDMESLMDHESHLMQLGTLDENEFPFDVFWNFDKCMAFNKHVVANNPVLCTLETYGQSGQGRALQAVVVDDKTSGANKDVIFMDAGTHSREWITVMSCYFFLNELLSGKPASKDLLSKFIVVLACLTNPDGFVYSWTNDRMWRKTRTINSDMCVGVDPNRNWDYGHKGPGSSNNTCSDVYSGTAPFSIPETSFLKTYMMTKKPTSYMNCHSYSQMFLLSFGCTTGPQKGTRYPGFDDDMKTAQAGIAALQAVNGTKYTAGNSKEVLYEACGCANDWAKWFGVLLSYTFELRDTGKKGFVLPANQIRPNCEEFTAAIFAIHKNLHARLLQQKASESETETILSEAV